VYIEIIIQVSFIPDDFMMQQMIFRTQQHLNSYARQGLRVLVMAKRTLSDAEYDNWLRKHNEAPLVLENRERRIRESYSRLETNLTLLGECVWQVSYLYL
jgi:phospholipid-translocating ATPase